MSAYSLPQSEALVVDGSQELVPSMQRAHSPAGAARALPALLSDVEDLLADVERALHVMAADLPGGDESTPVGGEAEALRWHLVETAGRVRDARETCAASGRWARRLAAARRTRQAD